MNGIDKTELVELTSVFYGFVADRWMFLTGDVDRLTHGATYIQLDDGTVEYKKISNVREALGDAADHEYQVEKGYLWVSDLEDDEYIKDAMQYSGLDDTDEELGIFDKIQACISYGCSVDDTIFGDDAEVLLGFDPEVPHYMEGFKQVGATHEN